MDRTELHTHIATGRALHAQAIRTASARLWAAMVTAVALPSLASLTDPISGAEPTPRG